MVKDHITATIEPGLLSRIDKYRKDPSNETDGERPTLSGIVELALDKFLPKDNP
jgi:hypothetical protein